MIQKKMKILRILLLALTVITLSYSCSDSDDTDRKYLYLPYQMRAIDSTAILTTTYTYDSNNRITGIANVANSRLSSSNHYIYTQITYNTDNNPGQMLSNVSEIVSGDTLPIYETTRTFSYEGTKIRLITNNSNGIEFSPVTIDINEKNQAVKRTIDNTAEFIVYEYNSRGSIAKTTNQEDSVYTYNYDVHRGIYREVNLQPWFVAVMDIPLDTIWANTGEQRNIHNNCISIQRPKKEESSETISFLNVYEYTYGGFWYPTVVSDNNSNSLQVVYKPVN